MRRDEKGWTGIRWNGWIGFFFLFGIFNAEFNYINIKYAFKFENHDFEYGKTKMSESAYSLWG